MAGSVNKVILVGNLGKDPEIRRTQDGRPIANLSVATSESWRDKTTGERKEKTEWHRVVIFNEGLCKIVEQYLKKGSQVYVEGSIRTRKWTDKEGQERYTTEIRGDEMKMLGSRQGQGQGGGDRERSHRAAPMVGGVGGIPAKTGNCRAAGSAAFRARAKARSASCTALSCAYQSR